MIVLFRMEPENKAYLKDLAFLRGPCFSWTEEKMDALISIFL